jgi:signal transduction histidine kinase
MSGAKYGVAKSLRKSAMLSAAIVVLVSIFSFGSIEYFANVVMGRDPGYDPILMIGMVGPMGLFMWLVAYLSARATGRYVSKLAEAIEKVAEGNFDTKLDEAAGGPYREIFADFNLMCRELQGVQTLRDDFINHFSHEFKTPITSINGFANLLLEEETTEEERRKYLEIIASESERLSTMSNSALLMTRLDSLGIISGSEAFALDEQIKRCAILLSPQWQRKRLDLSAELEPATCVGKADLLEQVWLNLISNAVKFTPEGGRILLGLRREGGSLVVTVTDTGKGMSPEELSRAFEKYYQGDRSASLKGLGLGLAIVKRIVELHGGRVEARSAPGQGSTFAVRLPAGQLRA